jgi:DNA-binding transcriptional regulator YiaG
MLYDKVTMKEWTPKQVVDFRLKNGLTQAAFGKMVGVSNITVYQWERGERRPSKTAKILLTKIEEERR